MNNAGILPIYHDHGTTFLLLGKEKGGWSTFSGKQEGDEDSTSTAIREFHEETAHTFPFVTRDYVKNNTKTVITSKTPSGKTIDLFIVDFSQTEHEKRATETFIENRSKAASSFEKEKTEIKWIDIYKVRDLKLRYCFYKDFPRILQEIKK